MKFISTVLFAVTVLATNSVVAGSLPYPVVGTETQLVSGAEIESSSKFSGSDLIEVTGVNPSAAEFDKNLYIGSQ